MLLVALVGGKEASAAKEKAGIQLINAERHALGIDPLTVDPLLAEGCRRHAEYMALNGYTGQEGPSKPGYSEAGAGRGIYGFSEEVLYFQPLESNLWYKRYYQPLDFYELMNPRFGSGGYGKALDEDLYWSPMRPTAQYSCVRLNFGVDSSAPAFFSSPRPGEEVYFGPAPFEFESDNPQGLVGIPYSQETGPPILLFSVGTGQDLRPERFEITGPDGTIPARMAFEGTEPSTMLPDRSAWELGSLVGGGMLLPERPLKPDSEYRIQVDWTNSNDQQFRQKFELSTTPDLAARKVIKPKLRFKVIRKTRRMAILKVRFSKPLRGKKATLKIKKAKISCDVTGSCSDGRTKLLRKKKIRLRKGMRIRVPIWAKSLVSTNVTLSAPRRSTDYKVVRKASAAWQFKGTPPGWHWY